MRLISYFYNTGFDTALLFNLILKIDHRLEVDRVALGIYFRRVLINFPLCRIDKRV